MFVASLLAIIPVILFLVSILYVILAERRLLAEVQGREGPSILGFFGALQTLVDGIKTFFKVVLVSRRAYKILFFVLPFTLLFLNTCKFLIIPLSRLGGLVDFEYDLLFVNLINSLEVFAFVLASWSALSSRFPTISAIRKVAQECATEALAGFCFMVLFLYSGSMSVRGIIDSQQYVWYVFVISPYAYIYYLTILSELHRTPVDVAESESELTAGYQSEHGGILFSLFYLSEYSGIIISSVLFASLFLGGWFLLFSLGACWIFLFFKAVGVCSAFVTTRSSLPRVRIKTLSLVFWSHLIPASSSLLLIYLLSGFIVGAFRLCEYCVYGIEFFKVLTRRFYYFTGNTWYLRSTAALDIRLDTSVAAFDYARQGLEYGEPGHHTFIDGTDISVQTYPYSSKLTDSLQIAGANTATGLQQLNNRLEDLPRNVVEHLEWRQDTGDIVAPETSFISKLRAGGLRLQELLLGDEMKFREISRNTPYPSTFSWPMYAKWHADPRLMVDTGVFLDEYAASVQPVNFPLYIDR